MSRKAVQGYSEKTYYDNTRYLGVLATNDPLNEGYFKHLVNFDISDTGQSITPRKGFLTTTLRYNDDYKTPISLSADTITFKDNNLGHYIAYDFKNKEGYIVDLTHYNIEDKLLPIVNNKISNYDWTEVVDYVLTYDTTIKAMYDEIDIGTGPGQYTTAQRYGIILSEIQKSFTDFGEDIRKVNQIIDKDTLTKTLFKVKITGVDYELPFFLSIYYREDAVTINGVEYPADTLVFGVVNMYQHPTYNIADRNIASDVSIIPSTMQTLYTASYDTEGVMISTDRPDGHINTLGPMYVKDATNKYYIEYVYPNVAYDMIPYMSLDPASIVLNNENAAWAYRFDIVSTKRFTNPEDALKEDIVFESNWFKYTGPDNNPTAIFNKPEGSDLSNSDRSLRHYKGNTLIITVIPKSVNGGTTTKVEDFTGGSGDQSVRPDPSEAVLTNMVTLYNGWADEVSKVIDKKSFREVISKLSETARFHVGYTTTTADMGMDAVVSLNLSETYISKTSQSESYANYFKTGSEILDMLDSGEIPDANLTFRLYPYVSNLKITYLKLDGTTDLYQWYFSDLTKFGKTTKRLYTVHNLNKGISTYNFSEINQEGNYEILVNTDIIQDTTNNIPDLKRAGFFEAGYSLRFYMKPYLPSDLADKTIQELAVMKEQWAASSYITSRQVLYAYDDLTVTTIPEVIVKDPKTIRNAKESIVFQDNRLVLWNNNLVYISEPGEHYYFKEENRKEFPEKVIKVIEYKTVLLVFTVQHLYVIYSEQVEVPLPDEKGNLVMTPSTAFAQQCVLYNILTDEKYADVIQVFNQMVLFYSADGQMFMIKPNVMIDVETQFSLQYFNKSANDVLKNYDVYINERLADYNIDKQVTKDDVQIRSLVSINYIKIFYTVPGYITYILIYDVIANRYTFYDTLTFTDIRDKLFVEGGEAYITVQDNKLFYTMPYLERNIADNYSDMSYINSFKKVAISCLVDSGNLNLNNHINKRYRDLHIVFKNLSASKLLFNAETVIDDIISHPYYDTRLEVRDINGASYFVTVPVSNNNDLNEFGENNLLMDFEGYTSSKLLTYRTSILGLGKVFRLKLQFISKGSYKIQSFGIVYKERRL